jgi:hypothetical protein
MASHTPGVWTVGAKGGGCVVTDGVHTRDAALDAEERGYYGGALIAESIRCQADARLIAAAPELLAACEALHARLFREQGGQERSPWSAPVELLRKAIALAKGE